MPTWVQKIGKDGRSRFVLKEGAQRSAAPAIAPDIEDYTSPVDGRLISGRRQRREDLRRHGCVEYDAGMKESARRNRAAAEKKLEQSMIERMRWVNA